MGITRVEKVFLHFPLKHVGILHLGHSNGELYLEEQQQKAYLKQYGILDSDVCTFCNIKKETLSHVFIKFTMSKQLWVKLVNLLPHQLQVQSEIYCVRCSLVLALIVKDQTYLNSYFCYIRGIFICKNVINNKHCTLSSLSILLKTIVKQNQKQ